jgi:hypothetical protein
LRHVLIALVLIERSAHGGGGPPTDAYEGIGDSAIDVHGFADVYFAYNPGDPANGQNQLRAFDTTANEPAIGWLRLRVAHRPRTFGFRVDLGIGDTANAYFAADPAATAHPELSRWLSHVGQAFATVVLPEEIEVDAGKFDTPVGLEDNESLLNWCYSRSLVFTWDEPSLHTGVRATYAITPEVIVAAFWLNGWNANELDGSTMRSYAAAARYKPNESLEAVLVYAGGLEHDPKALRWRTLIDAYVVYKATDALSLAATADYTPQFYGGAAYARYLATDWLAGVLRVERFADPEGIATGTAQTLDEITATLEGRRVVHGATLISRLEYRHDWSTADVFEHGTILRGVQKTVTLGLIASY